MAMLQFLKGLLDMLALHGLWKCRRQGIVCIIQQLVTGGGEVLVAWHLRCGM